VLNYLLLIASDTLWLKWSRCECCIVSLLIAVDEADMTVIKLVHSRQISDVFLCMYCSTDPVNIIS